MVRFLEVMVVNLCIQFLLFVENKVSEETPTLSTKEKEENEAENKFKV